MINRGFNWFYGHASIRKKLIISFGVLVSIPIIILGMYAYSQSTNNLMEQTIITMDNNVSRLEMEMNARFLRETDTSRYLAYNLNFRSALENNTPNNVLIAQTMNNSVEPTLWYFITSDSNMKGISIISPKVERGVGVFLKPDIDYVDLGWYQNHKSNFNTVWSVENGRLYATRTILDTATTSKMIAILRTEFYLNTMIEPIISMDYLDNGIIVKDRDQQIIYTKLPENKELAEAVLTDIEEKVYDDFIETKDYILKRAVLPLSEWEIYYYIDKEMISKQLIQIVKSSLLLVFICLCLILVFISILSKTLSKRILLLKGQAEDISAGNLEFPVFTQDTDEIGIVTNSLGKMKQQLNQMINQVLKMEIEKKATELKALQAMINPHFLYNCLSSIKWKAIKSGQDEISDITGFLAKFYRTALNNGQQITTVRTELENIMAYVEIQKRTHDNSFKVNYNLDETAMDYEMLNFLLQPIVENAIKHGIDYRENTEEKGLVIVEFKEDGDYLFFNIFNNGPPMELSSLERILNNPGKGYGIYNIKQRIDLYYGGCSGVYVHITDERYTCFTVKVAKKVEKDCF